MSPSVGLSARCAIPVFALADVRSKIAVPVVSEPVPAVVGIAMSGESDLRIGWPLPRGALTKSRNWASGWFTYRFAILAVSMTEPPPTAMKPSAPDFLAKSIASVSLCQLRYIGRSTSSLLVPL